VRCGRCGNENAEAHRFCGMCGAALVAKDPAAAEAAEQRSAASASGAAAEARRSSAPVITGPSFLGLNTPAPERVEDQVVERGGHDALRPSANVDYLLEDVDDDGGEPRRGWGKLILVVVALGLAAGFGYLHWKSGGFDWLNAGDKKPMAATAQAPDGGQSGADSGGATTAPQAGTAAVGGATVPGESGAGQASASQTSSETSSSPSPTSQSAASVPPAGVSAVNSPAQTTVPQSAEPQGAQARDTDSEEQSPAAEVAPRAAARKPAAAKPVAAKPAAAKPAAAKPVDAVTEAERYIYGRGSGQDCDRGVRMLKAAVEQSNVKAMISLGALYSTGTCTPRDLPTAYRWFALALHKEPENQTLQNDLQSLWAKMTQPERQLAIKLSQ
jgi:hypothetical protein